MQEQEKKFIENFGFSKNLGQNFLINSNTQERILQEIRSFVLSKNSKIIEIGPGIGAITKHLLNYYKIIAIELDKKLANYISKNFKGPNLVVINADCLTFDINTIADKNDFLFSNTPYSITTAIIHKWITSWNIQEGILLMQTEVANRITAEIGSKNYSAFSVFCNAYLYTKKLILIKPNDFVPMPKVMSSLVYIKKKTSIENINLENFWLFLQRCFSMRRKKLINNLKLFCKPEKILELDNIFNLNNKRAQEISPNQFIEIYKKYNEN